MKKILSALFIGVLGSSIVGCAVFLIFYGILNFVNYINSLNLNSDFRFNLVISGIVTLVSFLLYTGSSIK
jgi:hypothetical protein